MSTRSIPQGDAVDSVVVIAPSMALQRGTLLGVEVDGRLLVGLSSGAEIACDWLQSTQAAAPELQAGDDVLLAVSSGLASGVVVGRVSRYVSPRCPDHVTLEATESLTLQCGESSLEMRADGKVLVKGEDVVLRAKGTQRIRAGNVAIN